MRRIILILGVLVFAVTAAESLLDTTYTSGARFVLSLPLNPPA